MLSRLHAAQALRVNWRQLSGVFLLGLTASAFAMIGLRKTASEAYITGDIIHVRSPMQGRVISEPIGTGEIFDAGQALIRVAASREEEAKQDLTRLALDRVNSEIRATMNQLANLTQANLKRLRNDFETARRELLDLDGMEKRFMQQERRYRMLVKTGALDPESLAGAEAAVNSYHQRRSNQERIVDDLRDELAEAEVKIQSSITQLPRPSKRLELLEIEIIRLNQQLKEQQARKKELINRRKKNKILRYFIYRPLFRGIVLSNRTALDSEINENETLLALANCDKLKIEALFESARVVDKRVGGLVTIITSNNRGRFQGRIISIRGDKSIKTLEGPDAASFKQNNDDRMRVQISIPSEFKNRECRIGERVEVSL